LSLEFRNLKHKQELKRLFAILVACTALFYSVGTSAQKAFNHTIVDGQDTVVIHVLGHSSVLVEYDTLKVYVDPYSKCCDFSTMPKADIIIITHADADHFDSAAFRLIQQPSTIMVFTQTCASKGLYSGIDTIMANGDSINIAGVAINAVPAYNIKTRHVKGVGNAYIVQLGNKRIYFYGDGEKIPEMAEVHNIDIAFLGLSQPFNMISDSMIAAALLIQPKVLIPYHYDNNSTSELLSLMKNYPQIEVLTGDTTSKVTGVQLRKNNRAFIYPNPATNEVRFEGINGAFFCDIFDMTGRKVKSSFIRNEVLNIHEMHDGEYFLIMIDDKKSVLGTQKLVKAAVY
jgi:L-ascorbate metabolism protein UlaG (beta-lactamase superfamily)